jgi:hypothetical protein
MNPSTEYLNSAFIQQSIKDQTFGILSNQIKESTESFYLSKMMSFTVYSMWHFLGEPTGSGVAFAREFSNPGLAQSIKEKFFQKKLGDETLISVLEKTDSLTKSVLKEQQPGIPQPKREADLKALHDPVNVSPSVDPPSQDSVSVKKKITDWLEKTPDYLNFVLNSEKNVLVDRTHLIPEDILTNIMSPDSMITLKNLLTDPHNIQSKTFFKTITSPHLSHIALKMHFLSILLSKSNRTAFGLSHFDIDPLVTNLLPHFLLLTLALHKPSYSIIP